MKQPLSVAGSPVESVPGWVSSLHQSSSNFARFSGFHHYRCSYPKLSYDNHQGLEQTRTKVLSLLLDERFVRFFYYFYRFDKFRAIMMRFKMYQSKVESVRHCFTEIFIKITMLISMLCSRCCLRNVLSSQVIVVQGFTSLINVHRLNIF